MTMREIMTPEQVADYLQVNVETIYRLIRRHELAATRVGRAYRVSNEDLESYMRTHSSRSEVRDAMFRRVLAIAERNPGVDSDELLEELEAEDRERKRQHATAE